MKRQLRDKWAEKLRDPRTQQSRGALETNFGYCCLGVLANICEVPKQLRNTGIWMDFKFGNGFESASVVPTGFHGLTLRHINTLTVMNDTDGVSFPQIADWIEANIPVED